MIGRFESCRSDHFSLSNSGNIAPAPVADPVVPGAVAEALAQAAAALAAAAQALAQVVASRAPATAPAPAPGPAQVCHPFAIQPAPVSHTAPAPIASTVSVRDAINDFLVAKARAGRSDRYLRQLRVSLGAFAQGRHLAQLDAVTVSDVERWLYSRRWSARTMRGYLADVRTLFAWAHRRGLVASLAPVLVELPTAPAAPAPGIHTPDQVADVLEYARRADLDVLRHLAIRYFCGVRSSEAHRMDESCLLLDRGCVEVPAVKSKTRRRRLVLVEPALAAWLALGGVLRPIRPDTIRRVVRASGVPWPANVTRHSWCSYHLAAFGSAAQTAIQAGHSESMLFSHYRAIVTPAQAAAFWALRPR